MFYGCGHGFFSVFMEGSSNGSTLEPITIFQYLLDHPDDEIIQVEMKYNNVLLRSQFGQVLGCGFNECGELLTTDRNMRRFPVPILKRIKHCALGYKSSIFLDFDGHVTWCNQGKIVKIDGSKLKLPLIKVAIIGDTPFAIAKHHAFRVKSNGFVDCTKSGEDAFYFNRGSIKYKYERQYGMVTLSGRNLSEFFYEHNYDSIHFNSVRAKIIKVEASENHLVNLHIDKTMTSFGNNQYGQLGIGGTYNHYYSHEAVGDDCFEQLFFDLEDENLELDVFVGPMCTVAVTFTNNKTPIDLHAKNLLQNLVIINREIEEPSLKVYFPLIEIISPHLSAVLKNSDLLKGLSLDELSLCRELIIYICEIVPYSKSMDSTVESFHEQHLLYKYFDDTKSLTTLLFLLNDVQDCGDVLKRSIFSRLSSFIQVENVMQIISQTSDYLSRKVLKNSHNSILMLLVKKCIAFIKENYTQVRYLHGADEKLLKLSSRIEESKKPFDSIEMHWTEEVFTQVCSLSDAILLCATGNHDCTLIIDNKGTEIEANKQIIAKSSPVLETFFEKYSSNRISYNVYEFVKGEEDDEIQKIKSEALRILLVEACSCNYSNLRSCSDQIFIYILSMSHQFDMKDITKECCKIMFNERLSISNLEAFMVMSPIYDEETNMRLLVFLLKLLPQEKISSMANHLPQNWRKKLKDYYNLIYSTNNQTPLWMASIPKEELTEEEMISTINFIAEDKKPDDYDYTDNYE